MLLLDTCTLLWLVADQRKLSSRARKLLASAHTRLHVSAISAFEIGIKARRRALTLPLPAEQWYAEALEFHALEEIPITGAIAAASTALPPLHADPCDRMIVATARAGGLTVLTPDAHIHAYDVKAAW